MLPYNTAQYISPKAPSLMSLVLRFGEQVGVDLGCDVRNFDHISQLFLSILESVSFESIPGRLKRCVRVIFRDCI